MSNENSSALSLIPFPVDAARSIPLEAGQSIANRATRRRPLPEEILFGGHWSLDLATSKLTWSFEMFRMHGLDPTGPTPELPQALAFLTMGDQCLLLSLIDQAISTSGSFCVSLELSCPDGSTRPVICSATVVIVGGKPVHLFGTMIETGPLDNAPNMTKDAAEMLVHLIIANRDLEQLALHDELTGIANRRRFNDILPSQIETAQRTGQELSLILIDIDDFKSYNDHHGHPAGDDALRALGTLLNGILRRAGDFAARLGGEEFAIVLPTTGIAGAVALAERMRREFAGLRISHTGNSSGVLTISLGVAVTDPSIITGEMLIGAADQMLYRAKRNGRDQIGNLTLSSHPADLHIVR